jgi:hypothetical protein
MAVRGSVAEYYARAAIDGRAVLVYDSRPGGDGTPEPRLWLVRIAEAYWLCMDGPLCGDTMRPVAADVLIVDLVRRWRCERRQWLRSCGIGRPRKTAMEKPSRPRARTGVHYQHA